MSQIERRKCEHKIEDIEQKVNLVLSLLNVKFEKCVSILFL